jgi:hypothetical protein
MAGLMGEEAKRNIRLATSLARWAVLRMKIKVTPAPGPLQAKKGRFLQTNPILATVAWASLVVIQIVKEPSANPSNTLRRGRIGMHLESISRQRTEPGCPGSAEGARSGSKQEDAGKHDRRKLV